MKLLRRPPLIHELARTVDLYPVTLLLGPRQCGKTTLAKAFARKRRGTYFDLEDPETPLYGETAKTMLKDLRGLVVIDECQRQPDLFPLLRVLADRRPLPARFLILGSASPELVRGVSESMAGRVAMVNMGGFTLDEAGWSAATSLWARGGFPRSYLAKTESASALWRKNFIQTFLERDIPQLGIRVPAPRLRRFWMMLAHLHGQVWNASEMARALGTQENTARHYLDILTGAFMLRQLPAWYENVGKRLVKSPKIYFRDTGVLHTLLGLEKHRQLLSYPRFGYSWEGFALEQVIRLARADHEAFFYRTHAGAEIDLFIHRGGKRYGFEFKFSDAPGFSQSMHHAMADLRLDKLWVVYPGERSFPLREKVTAMPLARLQAAIREMG